MQRRRKTSVRKKEELDKEERKNKAGSLRVKERKKELTKKRWKNKIVR